MSDKKFKIYRRVCRSCLALFKTEHKHSRVCGKCKLRIKHMKELKVLKRKQEKEIIEYKNNQN